MITSREPDTQALAVTAAASRGYPGGIQESAVGHSHTWFRTAFFFQGFAQHVAVSDIVQRAWRSLDLKTLAICLLTFAPLLRPMALRWYAERCPSTPE